jgi:hypothetical protein
MQSIKIGLIGFGTVGRGTWNVLRRNQQEITRRAGRGIEVAAIAVRGAEKARAEVAGAVPVYADPAQLLDRDDIDIVVELIGGYEPARTLVLEAINRGKHVVTANKAMLARHGNEIFEAARARGVMVAFEAAVAGGIPIIKALREGLTANRIEWIAGIINGTSNFILSEMRARGCPSRRCSPRRSGSATPRPTRPSTSRASTPRTSCRCSQPSPSACRSTSTPPTPRASRGSPPRTSATPSSSATGSSCSASPSAPTRASSCACIRRWCRRSGCWPTSKAR